MIAVMRWVGVGVVVVVGSIGAWQYLSHQNKVQAETASNVYETLLSAVREHDVPKAEGLEQELVKAHPKSPYAALSAMLMASLMPEKSTAYLQSAIDLNAKGPFVHIARVRLARVMASEKHIPEALNLLNAVTPPEPYIRLYEEAKGDFYVQDNQLEKAKAAYALAIQNTPMGVPMSWLELKQSELSDKEGA
jgi:predicted negative regulator of RcsB-dependent stress response